MTAYEHPALAAAQTAMHNQQWQLAAREFDALLHELPDLLPARIGRARCAMLMAVPAQAVTHLQAATSIAPDNAAVARSLGAALLAVGSLDAAATELERARALQPQDALTHLHLGQVRERQHQPLRAAQAYYRALLVAQSDGRWLDARSTPQPLQAPVLHAMDVVDRERRGFLSTLLQPFVEAHGAGALARVDKCLQGHLKTLKLAPSDALQRPRFLWFPDLPSPRYLDPGLFPWREHAEGATAALRSEAAQALDTADALQPFLKFDSPEQVSHYLGGGDAPPAWDALFFYRDGVRQEANHRRCPQTAALLESLPLVRIREHAPEICFSVLAPGTHILPHTGVTNIRVVAHLPLIVPADCALEVGGELHHWRTGELMVFDDTWEHQAWNRSDSKRVILLMDAWNPYLTPVECQALSALIAGIGDFNRAV